MQLLVTGREPVALVAHQAGFRHQASFTAAFRKHFGLSPTEARQRLAPPRQGEPPVLRQR